MPKTLILIPGLGNTRRLFEAQIRALSGICEIAIADHTKDDSIQAMAARILQQAPERFALAGLSMGGYVAMEAMRQAPDRVERLALLDTSARPDTQEARQDRMALISLAEAGRLDEVVEKLWPRLASPGRRNDEALKSVVAAMMRETGPDAFIRQQRAIMGRPDSRASLSVIEIPTLVLVGEADLITPPDIAREIAERIEWASLVVVPGAGHLSTLEQPEQVSTAMRLWLTD